MKTRKIFVAVMVLLGTILLLSSSARPFATNESAVAITIRLKPSVPPTAPRSISAEIAAEYDDVLSAVRLALSNAGTSVDVSIENLTTSEIYGDTVSGSGMALIPISGSSGVWLLTISLENGDVYEGEFEL